MALAIVCVMALLAIFVMLSLVRMWGQRMQKQGGGCGGLDLKALRRQRDIGVISQKEYDIIVSGMAGAGSAATARAAKGGSEKEDPPKPPITDAQVPGADPDRSGPDGQG